MIVLSAGDVRALLPMRAAIAQVAAVMPTVSGGGAYLPLRTAMEIDGTNRLGIMPGVLHDPAVYGVKLISLFPGNPALGLSSHLGAMVLFDAQTGMPTAMIDADALTAIRTAAASAVATRALSRPEARVLAIIGTGEQAQTHIEALREVRDITEVRIAGRTPERAAEFVAQVTARHPDIAFTACDDARQAVTGADIVCTVTSCADPVLLGDWIAPGTHVNAVGASIPTMQEIDLDLVVKSRLFVDYRPSALAQARDIITALDSGVIDAGHILGELGEVLDGTVVGRGNAQDITLYRSLGIAAQDLICGQYALERAQERTS